jgi:hypothetical protein
MYNTRVFVPGASAFAGKSVARTGKGNMVFT